MLVLEHSVKVELLVLHTHESFNNTEDEFGGTLFLLVSAASGEKNTDSYNESSIFYGDENEDYGDITKDPSYGFGLNVLGIGTETYDDETDTYDQDITVSLVV